MVVLVAVIIGQSERYRRYVLALTGVGGGTRRFGCRKIAIMVLTLGTDGTATTGIDTSSLRRDRVLSLASKMSRV